MIISFLAHFSCLARHKVSHIIPRNYHDHGQKSSPSLMMIARSAGFQVVRHCARKPTLSKTTIRRFTSPATTTTSTTAASAHPLAAVTAQLDRVSPRFELEASAISILDSPTAFYKTLKVLRLRNLPRLSSNISLGQNKECSSTYLSIDTVYRQG